MTRLLCFVYWGVLVVSDVSYGLKEPWGLLILVGDVRFV